MTREQILTTGLSNSIGLLRTDSRTGKYSASTAQHRRKSPAAQRLHLSSIIEYCQAINSFSKQINQSLSKLMLERQFVFANTQLVNDDESLNSVASSPPYSKPH